MISWVVFDIISIAQFMSITWEWSASRSATLYCHDRIEHSKMSFWWFSATATSITGILIIVPQFLSRRKKGFQKTEQFIFYEGILHLTAHFGPFESTL